MLLAVASRLGAAAVEKAVLWAYKALLLQALLLSPSPPMNSDCDIVQRRAETDSDAVAGLSEDVRAPHDLRIVRLERWQELVKAVADCPIQFDVGFDSQA